MADLENEISTEMRAGIEAKLNAAKGEDPSCGIYTPYLNQGIIPFGDMYYEAAVNEAVRALYASGCPSCGGRDCRVDLIGVNRDAAAAQTHPWGGLEALLRRHLYRCTTCELDATLECDARSDVSDMDMDD